MPTIRIVIEIDAGEGAKTSVSVEQPQQIAGVNRRGGAIEARVRRLIGELGDNERIVLEAVFRASAQNRKVHRSQIMTELDYDNLLQFNGVLAWITRKYRKWVGEPESLLIENVWDEQAEDYSLEIPPDTDEDVLEMLKAEFLTEA